MSTALMSEQLTVVAGYSTGWKYIKLNRPVNADMLSSLIVDSQLSADLPSDSVSLFHFQLYHVNVHMTATNHNT